MTNMVQLIHDSTVAAAALPVLYGVTVTVSAMTALLARTAARRRSAREVLALLLRRKR
jgi:hypothetical protein